MKLRLRLPVGVLVCLLCRLVVAQVPPTPKRPVTDEYHGIKVTDDYRWLENWDDPEVKRWSAAESARARAYLDHLPARRAVHQRLEQLMGAGSVSYFDPD